MKALFIWPFFIISEIFAQTNDNCSNAIFLEVGDRCVRKEYSNITATAEDISVAPGPSCGHYKGADVWFTAVMPSSGALRIETNNLAGATPHSIALYSGTCGALTEVLCIQLDKQRTIFKPSLVGQTLYIRIYSYNGMAGSSFELCVWEPSIPANDNCDAAIEIPVGKSCEVNLFTNAFATAEPSTVAPDPSCGNYKGGDVWFKTMIPASGSLRIETENLWSATSLSVAVYTGSCGALRQIFCNQLDDEESFFDPAWAGEIAYIRVYNYGTEEGGNFKLCLLEPLEPFNDNCDQAFEIPATNACNKQVYTNALATAQPETIAPNPSCGAYRGGDVWFKTVMPASGKLRIETSGIATINARSLTLYTGKCGSMEEVFCSQLNEKIT